MDMKDDNDISDADSVVEFDMDDERLRQTLYFSP